MISKIKTGTFLLLGMFSYSLYADPPAYCADDPSCVREHERRVENADKILPLLQKIDQLNEQIAFFNMQNAINQREIRSLSIQHRRFFDGDHRAPMPSNDALSAIESIRSARISIQSELSALKAEKTAVWEQLLDLYPSNVPTVVRD